MTIERWGVYAVGILIITVAFRVMPDGPWYREMIAAILCGVGYDVCDSARKQG